MPNTVLVTGGTGFVGCHLVKALLDRGHSVHTTVRSQAHSAKMRPLRTLQLQHPGQLKVFEADLLVPGDFDSAMEGCVTVHHVASPFLLPEKIKNPRLEMLDPALEGTRNVLHSANRSPSVTRVVMTSTVGAVFGDYIDVLSMENETLSAEYFNTTSTLENNPYHYAKVTAELEAWAICNGQARWSLVTINPGMILGPSLTPASDSGSLFLLDELFRGYFFYGMPDLSLTTVDVREVAMAHIRAADNAQAKGRYILAEREMISFVEIANAVRHRHRRSYLLPRHTIPNSLVKLIGPVFGLNQQYLDKHLGIRFKVDHQRSLDDLGITYRPIAETLIDHYDCWERQRNSATR